MNKSLSTWNRNRGLDYAINKFFGDFFEPELTSWSDTERFVPSVDVEESDQGYSFKFDLPGVKRSDVKVEVENNQLKISGERNYEKNQTEGKRSYRERSYGTFYRIFTLPSNVDEHKVEASYEDGVLDVKVPKSERAKLKNIEIK